MQVMHTAMLSDRRALARVAILVPVAAGVAGLYDVAVHPGIDAALQPIGGLLIGIWGWFELRRGRPKVIIPLAVIALGSLLVVVSQMTGSGSEYGMSSVGPMVMLSASLLVIVTLWRVPLWIRIGAFTTILTSAIAIRQINAGVPATLIVSDVVASLLVVGGIWAVLQVGLDHWAVESSRLAAVIAMSPVELSEVEIVERLPRQVGWIPMLSRGGTLDEGPDSSWAGDFVRQQFLGGQDRGEAEISRGDRVLSVRWQALVDSPHRAVVAVSDITELVAGREALKSQIDEHHQRTAVITHELLQPLTGIQGMLQLSLTVSEQEADRDELAELLSVAWGQSQDAMHLTRDLLTMSQLTADFLALRLEAYPIRDLSEGLGRQFPEVEWSLINAEVSADPVRARQIVRNLVSNAHRYGGPKVEVVARLQDEAVVIEVRDNGDPIDPDEVEMLFEPFRQSKTGNAAAGSVGLGLNVSRRLAERMNGSLTYHHDGTESCFSLTLPAEPSTAPAP